MHTVAQGSQGRQEQRSLIAVAKRRDVALQVRMQLEPEARSDDQVARPVALARVQQPRIEVGGEEHDAGKLRPQRLQDEQLVVDVRAEHADGADAILPAGPFQLALQRPQPSRQTPQIVVLALSFRSFDVFRARLEATAQTGSFLLGPGRPGVFVIVLLVLLGQMTVEAAQVAENMDVRGRIGRPGVRTRQRARDRLGQRPGIERVPFRNEDDMLLEPGLGPFEWACLLGAVAGGHGTIHTGPTDAAGFQLARQRVRHMSVGSERAHDPHAQRHRLGRRLTWGDRLDELFFGRHPISQEDRLGTRSVAATRF